MIETFQKKVKVHTLVDLQKDNNKKFHGCSSLHLFTMVQFL